MISCGGDKQQITWEEWGEGWLGNFYTGFRELVTTWKWRIRTVMSRDGLLQKLGPSVLNPYISLQVVLLQSATTYSLVHWNKPAETMLQWGRKHRDQSRHLELELLAKTSRARALNFNFTCCVLFSRHDGKISIWLAKVVWSFSAPALLPALSEQPFIM